MAPIAMSRCTDGRIVNWLPPSFALARCDSALSLHVPSQVSGGTASRVPVRRWPGGEPSPGADVGAASPVPAQMWERRAQSRRRCCGRRPSPVGSEESERSRIYRRRELQKGLAGFVQYLHLGDAPDRCTPDALTITSIKRRTVWGRAQSCYICGRGRCGGGGEQPHP